MSSSCYFAFRFWLKFDGQGADKQAILCADRSGCYVYRALDEREYLMG